VCPAAPRGASIIVRVNWSEQMIQAIRHTLTTTFTYNGDGHRVAQATNGTTTYVVAVLGLSQVLVETTGGEMTRYVFGHDLLAEYDGVAWAYHLDDGLGSVRQLADGDGQVMLLQSYAPFGEPLWSEGSGITGFGFTGERWEAYSQLLFLRARYYEPTTGRFISPDTNTPESFAPSTWNVFLYVGDNPVSYFDPSGHERICPRLNTCPLPPSDKHWAYLGFWMVSVYGNADHERFGGSTKSIQWTGLGNGRVHDSTVSSLWLEFVLAEGTAGRLNTENGYVWIKCTNEQGKKPLTCWEVTEKEATKNLAVYEDVAINPYPQAPTLSDLKRVPASSYRKDVKKGDTVCIANCLNLVTVKDHGFGKQAWGEKGRKEWLDMYIGLHGYYDWEPIGQRDIWVLRPLPFPETCPGTLPCPI
jgi:RHS repeat-associated protein